MKADDLEKQPEPFALEKKAKFFMNNSQASINERTADDSVLCKLHLQKLTINLCSNMEKIAAKENLDRKLG